jgi:hypothetical protein
MQGPLALGHAPEQTQGPYPKRELHKLLDKAAVWLRLGALKGFGEEHGADDDAICAG